MKNRSYRLQGSIDFPTLLPMLNSAENATRKGVTMLRLEFDCLGVDDFTSYSLTCLARTRRLLLASGGDLVLTNCSERIASRMVHPIFEAMCDEASMLGARSARSPLAA